ncbi:hypothetical protein CP533_2861 [Ophiocordyceps camponoti-saundersi (nom. inval.)]|nr:hypothetical protein CP533_2861 [Ophiocordyceps camponoti-saundersi (nom. inval.)]
MANQGKPPPYSSWEREVENQLKTYWPGQPSSLSGIALRAFSLGIAFGASSLLTISILIFSESPLWRVPFFLIALSAFHFLEFWTTAEANTSRARIDSFLLTANWPSYAVAHLAAFTEAALVGFFFPRRDWAPFHSGSFLVGLGLVLVILGQAVRSVAMLHAGTSFNHRVQTRKAVSHKLVTTGIYSVLRHPSYFGFFYWSLGTQLVLGNVFCFAAYAAVLWKFFSIRIGMEESKLVEFFQDDYVQYRRRVRTMLPFIP